MLLWIHHLTRLEVSGLARNDQELPLESGVLAGKTRLQRLKLECCKVSGGAAGAGQLLSDLQSLQQLTHLDCRSSMWEILPPAVAFSALTTSSKLQHLDIRWLRLPAGVWQHVLPAGRQLPHLTHLDISHIIQEGSTSIPPAPEGRQLVSCCPGLQSLGVVGLHFGQDLLAAMQGLRELHTLSLIADATTAADRLHGLCQLTGLRDLDLSTPTNAQEELLLQLTQLRQLTALRYTGAYEDDRESLYFAAKVSWSLIRGSLHIFWRLCRHSACAAFVVKFEC
jgi:hypothetical protein